MNSHVIVGIRWVAGLFMEPELILAWMTAKLLCICNVIDLYHLHGWLCWSRTCVSLGWHGGEQSGKSKKARWHTKCCCFSAQDELKVGAKLFSFFSLTQRRSLLVLNSPMQKQREKKKGLQSTLHPPPAVSSPLLLPTTSLQLLEPMSDANCISIHVQIHVIFTVR